MSKYSFEVIEHFGDEDFERLLNEYILSYLKKIAIIREEEKRTYYNYETTTTAKEVSDK